MEFLDEPIYKIDFFGEFQQSKGAGTIGFETLSNDFVIDRFEDSTSMDIESSSATKSGLEEEKCLEAPKAEKTLKDNHSKDCLKFCRRIASVALGQLSTPSENTKAMIGLNSGIISTLINNLGLNTLETIQINSLQTNCLRQFWQEAKDIFSYSTNKKICIVKQEYWNMIFDKVTSVKHFEEICRTLSMKYNDENVRAVLQVPAFVEIFARLLFGVNKMMILCTILREKTLHAEFLQKLETFDNFVLLALLPEYFQFYNHRSGKFALECCGKCKVCKSKMLPRDFLNSLKAARQQVETIVSRITQLCRLYRYDEFQLAVLLMEFAYSNF